VNILKFKDKSQELEDFQSKLKFEDYEYDQIINGYVSGIHIYKHIETDEYWGVEVSGTSPSYAKGFVYKGEIIFQKYLKREVLSHIWETVSDAE
jgi:hypothetical protein